MSEIRHKYLHFPNVWNQSPFMTCQSVAILS